MGLIEKWREIAETLETAFQMEHGSRGATARESARVRRQCADELEARDKELIQWAQDLLNQQSTESKPDELVRAEKYVATELLRRLGD